MNKRFCLLLITCLLYVIVRPSVQAQRFRLQGQVVNAVDNRPISFALLELTQKARGSYSDSLGNFSLGKWPAGTYTVRVRAKGFDSLRLSVQLPLSEPWVILLQPRAYDLAEVLIEEEETFALVRLNEVSGMGIYAGRKTEVVPVSQLTANLATNNSRQVFARVAGLNIWESDCAGLQLGIGGRGLSPNRTANFNTRQGGYDMSADALGYPESYYSPPMQALERVEIVRGAASLQYGPQFGGMANFVLKDGPKSRKLALEASQTLGSFGFYNAFTSLGGSQKNLQYYGFYQYRQGNCWRPNSGFEAHNAYGSLTWTPGARWRIRAEYTRATYQAQQPGGLSDADFARDPGLAPRSRNFFAVDWNMAALTMAYAFSSATRLEVRNFGMYSSRDAVGYRGSVTSLDPIEVPRAPDFALERDLLKGQFRNIGQEARLLHRYAIKDLPQTLLVGTRLYRGFNRSQQGFGSTDTSADFRFINPARPGKSSYDFPSLNLAAFAEHIFRPSARLSITPGIRLEYIRTEAVGYSRQIVRDLADNIILDETNFDSITRPRSILLGGLGLSYKHPAGWEGYANLSQNYRAISFTDFREQNPSFRVDPDLQDERGFNADLGWRGQIGTWLNVEATAFMLAYQDRIGAVQRVDTSLFSVYRFRTNVSDSHTFGLETYAEADLWRLFSGRKSERSMNLFSNLTLLRARYVNSAEPAFEGNLVEMVPDIVWRSGLRYRQRNWSVSSLFSYVGMQFSDATNAIQSGSAVVGIIPAYYVADLSASYTWSWLTLEASVNNLTDNRYFTRRATGYPGPGIIPADARSFFLTAKVNL